MKLGAIILARMDSARLPGKALRKIGDQTLIEHCISKINAHSSLVEPILATSEREVDIPLVEVAKKTGIKYFTGDLNNVGERVLKCIDQFSLDYFARINGDSPFLDPSLLSLSFDEAITGQYDFVTNLMPRSFPYGVSVEVFNTTVYREGYHNFKGDRKYEEHITSYFYDNIKRYKFKNIESGLHLSSEELRHFRLVIDTPEDYEIITEMYNLDNNIFNEDLEKIYRIYKQVTNNNKIKQHL